MNLPVQTPDFAEAERAAYRDTLQVLPAIVERARLTLCGFCACVDKTFDLHVVAPHLLASDDADANRLGRELRRRAAAGIGGEIRIDWPAGPAWLDRFVDQAPTVGGTSAQAANVLAILGAPTLLALEERGVEQLVALHPEIRLAQGTDIVPARSAAPRAGGRRPAHHIFAFTEGRPLADIVPKRSTRVILRFADDGLEHDPDFEHASVTLARIAGAAILSGFNNIPEAERDESFAMARRTALAWRAAGLATIHLELGDYPQPELRALTLERLAGGYTSLGMNINELGLLLPGDAPPEAKARALAERLRIERVAIHADDGALCVTRGDPECERLALRMGCLLAATRAALGRPAPPRELPADAEYRPTWRSRIAAESGWHTVTVSAPYLRHPKSTLGLGDTFVAGTSLVLGALPA